MPRHLARLAPVAVTLALLALLARQFARHGGEVDLASLLAHVSPPWIAAGALCFVAVNVVRAVRFRVLIPTPGLGIVDFMPIGFALSFLNNVLPLRAGEVVFVVAMRSGYGVALADSTAALGLARILDYLAVAAWFVPLAALSWSRLPRTTDWPAPGMPTAGVIGLVIGFMVVLAATLFVLAGLGERAVRWLERLLALLGLADRPAARRVIDFGARAVRRFDALRTRRTYGAAFGLTMLLWLGIFAWQYSFARGLGLRVEPGAPDFAALGFGLFVVGATFGSLSKAIPVPTLGGHGVTEAGWTLGFALVGVPVATAIASSLGITVLTLAVSTALGVPALVWLEVRRRGMGTAAGGAEEAGEEFD